MKPSLSACCKHKGYMIGPHRTTRLDSRRGIFGDGPKSSSVPDRCECLRGTFAAKRDQLLRAPELKKAARIARYLYRYVGRVCGELEACDRVIHRFHGCERNVENPVLRRTPCPRAVRAPDEHTDAPPFGVAVQRGRSRGR